MRPSSRPAARAKLRCVLASGLLVSCLALADSGHPVSLAAPAECVARPGDTWASGGSAAASQDRKDHPGSQAPYPFADSIKHAEALLASGHSAAALENLIKAMAVAQQGGDPAQIAAVTGALGNAQSMMGSSVEARRHLELSIAKARECDCQQIEAVSLNSLGNLLAAGGNHREALARYRESAALGEQAGSAKLAARALTNAGRAALAAGEFTDARALLDRARKAADRLQPSPDKTTLLLALGRLFGQLSAQSGQDSGRDLLAAHSLLMGAKGLAASLSDRRATSYALGYMGELYERERRYSEALRLTKEALFAAQEANAPEIEYRWHWQSGRLLKAQGETEAALAAYRSAVGILQSIRPDLAAGSADASRTFQTTVKPVYYELVDLLLGSVGKPNDDQAQARHLTEAQAALETFKAVELQDYFQDECVAAVQSKPQRIGDIAPRTAVIYPIVFPDRIELLLGSADGIRHVTSRVTSDAFTSEVNMFREALEKPRRRDYLPHAQQLYDWLIRPLAPLLEARQIDTLVVVPDGPLRTVPMAALHDGEDFLVRRYALVTSPGLTLTDARPFRSQQVAALLGGLSEAVQGYPALPEVPAEFDAVERLFPSKRLQDQAFVVSRLQEEIAERGYTLVHIATHARFDRDAGKSFILTYDGKLSMTELEDLVGATRYSDRPVELLSLSACETALGDERAALGLAGVAVKAGARSAVATLWQVSDEAAAALLPAFYRQLKNPAVSTRAQALRNAQLELMSNERYHHPAYWSPFLLIGNWL